MILSQLKVENFRNIDSLLFLPHSQTNVIWGDNGQGKTNLIEALWLFTGAKSFRGGKDTHFLKKGKDFFRNEIVFDSQNRTQTAAIAYDKKTRLIELNGVKKKSNHQLTNHFYCVVFSPSHLSLIKDGPAVRRLFLDTAICQNRPGYISLLYSYKKAIKEKNTLLKDIRFNGDLADMLDIYDMEISRYATAILKYRFAFIDSLSKYCSDVYKGLSSGKEEMKLSYDTTFCQQAEPMAYFEYLKQGRALDLHLRFCARGIHRDDLKIEIDGMDARIYASQGQQRSAAIAMKLAEGKILFDTTAEKPIMLLDDVLSELDDNRQDYLLNHIRDNQVFITCCNKDQIKNIEVGKTFHVLGGMFV